MSVTAFLKAPVWRHIPPLARLFRDGKTLYRRNRQGGRRLGHQHRRLWRRIKLGDCAHDFATITKDNAEVFQVTIGQIRQGEEIDPILGKSQGVLGHAELFEPSAICCTAAHL
jgi:hypothetical protein